MDEKLLNHLREIEEHLIRIHHLDEYDPQLRRFFQALRSHLKSIKEENSIGPFWKQKQ